MLSAVTVLYHNLSFVNSIGNFFFWHYSIIISWYNKIHTCTFCIRKEFNVCCRRHAITVSYFIFFEQYALLWSNHPLMISLWLCIPVGLLGSQKVNTFYFVVTKISNTCIWIDKFIHSSVLVFPTKSYYFLLIFHSHTLRLYILNVSKINIDLYMYL